MKLNERIINYDSFDFILIPPQMKHVLYWSEYGKFDNYVIWFQSQDIMLDLTHAIKLHDYDGAVQHLCKEIFRLYTLGGMDLSEIINAYLYTVLLYMRRGMVMNTARIKEQDANRIQEAIKFINLNILNKPLSIQTIADEIGYSAAHFSREFHRQIGVSPIRYLIEVRVSHAKRLLTESGESIQEISSKLFYEDPLYFSRQFSKATGLSPTKFRELYTKA